jgi:hypothetical protein
MQFLKESVRSGYLPKLKLKQGLDTFTVEVQITSPLMDMDLASTISPLWFGGCPPIEPAEKHTKKKTKNFCAFGGFQTKIVAQRISNTSDKKHLPHKDRLINLSTSLKSIN